MFYIIGDTINCEIMDYTLTKGVVGIKKTITFTANDWHCYPTIPNGFHRSLED